MPAPHAPNPPPSEPRVPLDCSGPGAAANRRPLRRQQIRPVAAHWTIAAACRHWIDLRSSMTREIELRLGTRPEVRLLREGPDGMSAWEADALALPRRGRAYAREIALVVEGRAVMLARSLSPMADPVTGVLRRLQRAPLADVLFRDPRWRRSGVPVALRWRSENSVIPGRACLWRQEGPGGRVLVEEFFLAPLTEAAAAPGVQ